MRTALKHPLGKGWEVCITELDGRYYLTLRNLKYGAYAFGGEKAGAISASILSKAFSDFDEASA